MSVIDDSSLDAVETGAVTGDRTAHQRFRPDIQGLRAVAVILVILAHASVPGFEGGYIGVDVFFVISGFVITSLLRRQPPRHVRQNLAYFYARRIRRIVPAATLTLVATTLAAYFLLGTNFVPQLRGGTGTVLGRRDLRVGVVLVAPDADQSDRGVLFAVHSILGDRPGRTRRAAAGGLGSAHAVRERGTWDDRADRARRGGVAAQYDECLPWCAGLVALWHDGDSAVDRSGERAGTSGAALVATRALRR